MNVEKNENTPLLRVPGSDNSLATPVDLSPGSSEDHMPAPSPLEVAAAKDNTQAHSVENGAAGGKEPPKQNQPNQNQPNQNQLNPQHQPKPNSNDRYFLGDLFPRYLVVRHKDPNQNIASKNPFTIEDGFNQILSARQIQAMRIDYLTRSHMLVVEVDGKPAAEKLLQTKYLGTMPVTVEVHKTKTLLKVSSSTKTSLTCQTLSSSSVSALTKQ